MKSAIFSSVALATMTVSICHALYYAPEFFPGPFDTVNEGGRGRMVMNKMLNLLYELPCAGLPRANTTSEPPGSSFVANIMIARAPQQAAPQPLNSGPSSFPATMVNRPTNNGMLFKQQQPIPANVTAQENTLLRQLFAAARGVWLGNGAAADDVARCAAMTGAHQKWIDFRKANNINDGNDVPPPPPPMPISQPGFSPGAQGGGVVGDNSFSNWNPVPGAPVMSGVSTQWSNNNNNFPMANGGASVQTVSSGAQFPSNGQMGQTFQNYDVPNSQYQNQMGINRQPSFNQQFGQQQQGQQQMPQSYGNFNSMQG